ncbi:DUF705 domain-containing protein [Paucibacter sp. PLA-PC-4]|uniref:DUF705 domain-containing protein n=1 Tax=Paucibacter sp. PLA-PC-4 TaxID=2993655 RepID=UPI002248D35F|nr:DUF705 domain-containing protein [Paucibacter sp. PLA-PC-4]MCX2861592.1 DUF705 domain-containing protein [Paucibacter sp. PLA-PC-4]
MTAAIAVPLVVYVDVDDTLVRSVGSKRIPMTRVVEHVRQLKAAGAVLYCWSSGGGEYARQSAVELGIEQSFQAFLPKPNVMIDDQSVADWRLCLEMHPLSIEECSPDQYWGEIRAKQN